MERIGKYHIQKVLGRGGMGTVYEAIDPLINRKVALKTMNTGMAEDADLRTRFLREAQAGGALRHRNIVTVYDLGEDKGRPFIAMEFIEGTDLEKIIQQREPHPVEWKLDVLRQVCEGLGYAHRAGIVHRDVKPANIRVTPEGEVKIMDFGIAHLQTSTMTKSGLVMGTVHYMAPEQVEGHKIDHRADIFAVGAIAYELIAYKRPFDGESITAVMFKIIQTRPDLDVLPKTEFSPRLEQIVGKALNKPLAERYQSLDEMQADLRDLLQSRPAPVGTGTRPGRNTASGLGEAAAQARREREMSDMRVEIERARADGQLQKAMVLARKLVEQNPNDAEGIKLLGEVEALIHDKEVEQLCGMALAYAADGDMDLALKIAARIERLAPHSPRFQQLRSYLEEEVGKKGAEALTSSAQEHLALGNLEEAVAAAEEALTAFPNHQVAREIRDRAKAVLDQREKSELDARSRAEAASREAAAKEQAARDAAAKEQAARETAAKEQAAREAAAKEQAAAREAAAREAAARDAAAKEQAGREAAAREQAAREAAAKEAAAREQAARDAAAREHAAREAAAREQAAREQAAREAAAKEQAAREAAAREHAAAQAVPAPPAAAPAPPAQPTPAAPAAPAAVPAPAAAAPGGGDPKAEAAIHTQTALNHFMQNNYVKARKAAEKALALEPGNKKAKELMKILGSLS